MTERFDILAWNAAYAVLIPRTAEDPPARRNTLLYSFTRSQCCRRGPATSCQLEARDQSGAASPKAAQTVVRSSK